MNINKSSDEPEPLFDSDIDTITSGCAVVHDIPLQISKEIEPGTFSKIDLSIKDSQKKYENSFMHDGLIPDPSFELNNSKREEELNYLLSKGVKSNFFNTRLRYGDNISEVCLGCPNGDYGSHINVSMTELCNKDCFFCYNNKFRRAMPKYDEIYENIKKRKSLLNTLSFTGGEPLLELDAVFSLMKLVRQKYGSLCYTYTYTNGALLTEEILVKFKELGLNEIRFDIAANNYDLEPVKLAKKYIPKVTIETPVIPGEKDQLLSAINELEKIGILFITLHELLYFGFNSERYKKREYYLKTPNFRPFYFEDAVPILGSEELIYEIFKYALDRNLKTSLHYCSCDLKQLFQHRSSLFFKSRGKIPPQREIKDTGLAYSFLVSLVDKEEAIGDIKKSPFWNYRIHSEFLEVHPSNIINLDPSSYDVYISYWKDDEIVDIGRVISKN